VSWRILDSSAAHTHASIHPLDEAEDGLSPRHLRQSAVQWTFPVGCVSARRVPHADCVTRLAVIAQITRYTTIAILLRYACGILAMVS